MNRFWKWIFFIACSKMHPVKSGWYEKDYITIFDADFYTVTVMFSMKDDAKEVNES